MARNIPMTRPLELRPTGLFFHLFSLHLLLSGIVLACLCLWGLCKRKDIRGRDVFRLSACALAIAVGLWYFKPFPYMPDVNRISLNFPSPAVCRHLPESEYSAVLDCIMPLRLRVPRLYEDIRNYNDATHIVLLSGPGGWEGDVDLFLRPAASGPSVALVSGMGPRQQDFYIICNPEVLPERLDPYFEVQYTID